MPTGRIESIKELGELFNKKSRSKILPSLFIGHGSPMNAIKDNSFTRSLKDLSDKIAIPEAILCISAHWMTEGSWITRTESPKTIHDFYRFPKDLFDIQYPAPGRPDISDAIRESINYPQVHSDNDVWGLDHGTWSVLRHMYPEANIPVMQLSLYMSQTPSYHFKLGQELAKLRNKGVLIIGSGNIVHNLREIRWEDDARPYEWAIEFDEWSKKKIIDRDFQALQQDFWGTEAGKLSIPTMEHYYPLLYTLGSALPGDEVKFEYEEIQNGSISMRCLSLGIEN